jgi:hypothetical protein
MTMLLLPLWTISAARAVAVAVVAGAEAERPPDRSSAVER